LTPEGLIAFAVYFFCFLMSISAHEWAHAWMADRWGDSTARLMGRMTLNPLKHIDPMFTVVVPLVAMFTRLPLIGGAKPVPVDTYQFSHREHRRAERMVSLAGVTANFIIAAALSVAIRLMLRLEIVDPQRPEENVLFGILGMTMFTNLSLVIFNLLPIPPLDGSGVVATFLPHETAGKYIAFGRQGFFLIMILLFTGVLGPIFNTAFKVLLVHVLRLDMGTLILIGRAYSIMFENLGF